MFSGSVAAIVAAAKLAGIDGFSILCTKIRSKTTGMWRSSPRICREAFLGLEGCGGGLVLGMAEVISGEIRNSRYTARTRFGRLGHGKGSCGGREELYRARFDPFSKEIPSFRD